MCELKSVKLKVMEVRTIGLQSVYMCELKCESKVMLTADDVLQSVYIGEFHLNQKNAPSKDRVTT